MIDERVRIIAIFLKEHLLNRLWGGILAVCTLFGAGTGAITYCDSANIQDDAKYYCKFIPLYKRAEPQSSDRWCSIEENLNTAAANGTSSLHEFINKCRPSGTPLVGKALEIIDTIKASDARICIQKNACSPAACIEEYKATSESQKNFPALHAFANKAKNSAECSTQSENKLIIRTAIDSTLSNSCNSIIELSKRIEGLIITSSTNKKYTIQNNIWKSAFTFKFTQAEFSVKDTGMPSPSNSIYTLWKSELVFNVSATDSNNNQLFSKKIRVPGEGAGKDDAKNSSCEKVRGLTDSQLGLSELLAALSSAQPSSD